MFYGLIRSFTKFGFYLRRLIGPLVTDGNYQQIRKTLLWVFLLIVQLIFNIKFLVVLLDKIPNLARDHQRRLALQKEVAQTKRNIARIKASPQAVETIIQSLPGAQGNYNLLEKLNSLAAGHQLSLLSINFLPIEKSNIPGLLEQPIEVRIEGPFVSIFDFLDQLRNDSRPTLTENLTVETKENNLSSGYIQAEAQLKTYLIETN